MCIRSKKMWRVVIILASVFLFSIGASSQSLAEEKKVLNFTSHWWLEPVMGDLLSKWCTEFEQQYPNVTFKKNAVSWVEEWDKLMIQLSGGLSVDLIPMYDIFTHRWVKTLGFLTPLDKYIDFSKHEEHWDPNLYGYKFDGKPYAFPWNTEVRQFFYNKALLGEAGFAVPTTPTELKRVAIALTKGKEQYGLAICTDTAACVDMYQTMLPFGRAFGGRISVGGVPTINDPKVIQGLELLNEIWDANAIPKGIVPSVYRRMFWQGKIGMINDFAFLKSWAESQNPDIAGKIGCVDVPFPDKASAGGVGMIAVPSTAKYPAEAAKFIEYIGTLEKQREFLYVYGYMPVRRDAVPLEYLEQNPWFVPHTRVGLGVPPDGLELIFEDVAKIVTDYLSEILFDDKPVASTMDRCQEKLLELVKIKGIKG